MGSEDRMSIDDKLLTELYIWQAKTKMPPYSDIPKLYAKWQRTSYIKYGYDMVIEAIKKNEGKRPLLEVLNNLKITIDNYGYLYTPDTNFGFRCVADVIDQAIDIYYSL